MPLVRHEIERRDLRRRGTLSTRYGQAVDGELQDS